MKRFQFVFYHEYGTIKFLKDLRWSFLLQKESTKVDVQYRTLTVDIEDALVWHLWEIVGDLAHLIRIFKKENREQYAN